MLLGIEDRLIRGHRPRPDRAVMMAVQEHIVHGFLGLMLFAAGPLAAMGQGGVDGHAVQPSRKGRLATKRVELAHDLEQHVLGDVLGVGIVAEHSPR